MHPLIEPLERRQLCHAPADLGPVAVAEPVSAPLQIKEVEILPPAPHYEEVALYTGFVRYPRGRTTPVDVLQLYQLPERAPAGTRLRFPDLPDGEFVTTVQLRNRRFVMKASRLEQDDTLLRTVEFRGRLKRNGEVVTGTYRWQVSPIVSYRAAAPIDRGRAPFRLEARATVWSPDR